MQSKIIENSIPDSVSAIPNVTNVESEFEAGHDADPPVCIIDADPPVCIITKDLHYFFLVLRILLFLYLVLLIFFTVVLYFIKKLARKSDLTRYLLSWLHAFVS